MRASFLTAITLSALMAGGPVRAQSNATVFGDNFAQGKLDDYIVNAAKLHAGQAVFEATPDGKGNSLVLNTNTAVSFKFVPVKDSIKYKFAFMVRAETRETIEENPRLEGRLVGWDAWIPDLDICFYDAEMKCISSGGRPRYTLPFGAWFNSIFVLYPPANTAFMQVTFDTKKESKLFLRDFTLDPAADEGAINCYPTMNFGKYNCHIGGHLLERADGRLVWDSGYGCLFGESMPLSPGRYKLYAKGFTYGGYSTIGISFLDRDGRTISGAAINSAPGGNQKEFEVPEGTVRGSMLIYNNVIEELRLTRMGDEKKDEKSN